MVKRGNEREKRESKEKFDVCTQITTSRAQIYTMNKDSDKWQTLDGGLQALERQPVRFDKKR